ncbi:MAG: CotH kinase family protein [Christensenellaceae bacterium]|jgi:hypothetical protein|nr:CotH kinase family protein [Christensenellaceae bacterium]
MNRKAGLALQIVLFGLLALGLCLYAVLSGAYAPSQAVAGPTAGQSAAAGPAGLQISEIMLSNEGAVVDEDGDWPAWVELYNSTSSAVSLGGFSLSDRDADPSRSKLPALSLAPGERVVVFLSGKGRLSAGSPLHTSFKLKAGESLYLFQGTAAAGDMPFIQTRENLSYALIDGVWTETGLYSPGFANDEAGHAAYLGAYDRRAESKLKINEVLSSNVTILADEEGLYPDWIELINLGDVPIDLSGYALSDTPSRRTRWRFPGGQIGPGETLLVFASGKDRADTTPFHTNFAVAAKGETILLCDPQGNLLDSVALPDLKDDVSYARASGGGAFAECLSPTPGLPNTAENGLALQRLYFETRRPSVYISEAVSNSAVSGEGDWLELYNAGGEALNLSGYSLSDRASRPGKFVLGEQTLPAGGYLRVDISEGAAQGELRVAFHVKAGGEGLYFFDPDGKLVDRLLLPPLNAGLSFGRAGDGALFYYKTPTPGAQNAEGYASALRPVRFSQEGGAGIEPFALELYAEEGAAIYYSLDGSEPDPSSKRYAGPIQITKNTVLRAVAIRAGALDSPVATQSYLPEAWHSLRVVSLVTDPVYLWSDSKGIYANGPNYQAEFPHGSKNHGANFWMDWEQPVNVEIFEPGGATLLSQGGAFKINGQYSRALPQKSFAVYARKEQGASRFDAPLFSNRDYTSYKSFVLRSTAQDHNRARMRDVICTAPMLGQDVLYQESEVCVVYINGEYWGHYNMRERVNKWSIAQWEGITDEAIIDRIDLLKGNGKSASQTLNGSNTEYRALIDYVRANDLTNEAQLNYVLDRVDVQNYFDYLIAEIFWANSDTGNIKFYKLPGGKWKWILYDLDWAMNNSESMPVSWNTFAYVLHLHDQAGTGVGHSFETVLSYKLLANPKMKTLFLERLAYFMKNVYTSERLVKLIEEQEAAMLPEMERHFARWPEDGSVSSWQKSVSRIKEWVQKRPDYVLENCESYFKLNDTEMKALFGALEDQDFEKERSATKEYDGEEPLANNP